MLDKAKAMASAGRMADAERIYAKLLDDKPKNAVILAEAVRFHNRFSGQTQKAAALVERLLGLKPKAATSHALAAETALNLRQLKSAYGHAADALRLGPSQPDVLFVAAATDMALNRYDDALAKIERSLAKQPDHLPTLIQKARGLIAAGALQDAEELLRALMAKHPQNPTLVSLLFGAAKLEKDDPEVRRFEEETLPGLRTIGGPLYAEGLRQLAAAQAGYGDHAAAFESVQKSKALVPMQRDTKGYAAFVDGLCSQITSQLYAPASGSDSDRPVLIVGMPRSGSTLLEQMLSRHPDVASVGESPALPMIVQEARMHSHNPRHMLSAIREIPGRDAARLADVYLEETATLTNPPKRVVDKSLHNFELLGFFAKLFPKARVIHTLRDPLDTCVSCYLQPLSPWHSYTQDLTMLGQAYMQHRQLMDHWAEVLPNPIFTLRYEDLVDDAEATLRGVLDFLQIEWDPVCLDFQKSENRSTTLSQRQVRQPLYRSSIRRWKSVEKHLDPLKEELRPLYPNGWTESYR